MIKLSQIPAWVMADGIVILLLITWLNPVCALVALQTSSQAMNTSQYAKSTEYKNSEFVFFPKNHTLSGTRHEHLLKMENLLRDRGWQVKNYGNAGLILIPGSQP